MAPGGSTRAPRSSRGAASGLSSWCTTAMCVCAVQTGTTAGGREVTRLRGGAGKHMGSARTRARLRLGKEAAPTGPTRTGLARRRGRSPRMMAAAQWTCTSSPELHVHTWCECEFYVVYILPPFSDTVKRKLNIT